MTTSLKEALDASWSADRTISFFDFSGPYESFSFQQFGRKVWAYERHLTTLGAGPGSVIAVMGPTCSDIAALCAAVWSVGSTLTVLANPTRLSGLEHFLKETLSKLRESGADVLIGEEECIAPLRHLAGIPVLNYQQVRQAEAEEPKAGPAPIVFVLVAAGALALAAVAFLLFRRRSAA